MCDKYGWMLWRFEVNRSNKLMISRKMIFFSFLLDSNYVSSVGNLYTTNQNSINQPIESRLILGFYTLVDQFNWLTITKTEYWNYYVCTLLEKLNENRWLKEPAMHLHVHLQFLIQLPHLTQTNIQPEE